MVGGFCTGPGTPFLKEFSPDLHRSGLLGSRHLEAVTAQAQPARTTGATEPVLGHLKLSVTDEGLVLLLPAEVDVAVDHVLHLVATGEGAALGDLANGDDVGEVLFRPRGELLQRPLGGPAGDPAGVELAIVETLE